MGALDGRVAIVTGAGRGLGRAEALELAAHGARVVVNDFGLGLHGEAEGASPAGAVVDEIRGAGGEAVAHHGDVADWDDARGLVELAVESFGGLDILVNNAGILRDRMIFSMAEDEWDAVIRVHLKGHFCTTRWATGHWREQSKAAGGAVYGRIVNTASEAFLGLGPGQPNYSSAKAGIVALTKATAAGCGRYGVTANAICPRARTRMTDGLDWMGDAGGRGDDPWAPGHVTPLVAWLASPAAAADMIRLLADPPVEREFTTETGWTVDQVDGALAPHFT